MKRIVVLLCLLSVLWPGTAQTFIRSLPTSTNLTSATKVPVDDATYGTRAVTLQNLLASTATNATLLAAITNVVEDTATSLLANKLDTTNGTAVNLIVDGAKPTLYVTNVAAMRALSGLTSGQLVQTAGRTIPGYGGATFLWTAGLTTTTNLGTVFDLAPGGTGRFTLAHGDPGDIRLWGAIGDNSTDSAANIQAALDSVGTLSVPAGTYRIASKISVPSNTRIYGAGAGSVIRAASSSISALEISGKSNILIQGLSFLGASNNSASSGATGNAIYIAGASSGVRLTDIRASYFNTGVYVAGSSRTVRIDGQSEFYGCAQAAVNTSESSDVIVDGAAIDMSRIGVGDGLSGRVGVWFQVGTTHSKVSRSLIGGSRNEGINIKGVGCAAFANTVTNCDNGIILETDASDDGYSDNGAYNTVGPDNYISDIKGYAVWAGNVIGVNNSCVHDALIHGNIVRNSNIGIAAGSAPFATTNEIPHRISILNNDVTGCTNGNITITAAFANVVGNVASNTPDVNISLYYCNNSTVSHNTVANSQKHGIALAGGGTGNTVAWNTIKDASMAGSAGYESLTLQNQTNTTAGWNRFLGTMARYHLDDRSGSVATWNVGNLYLANAATANYRMQSTGARLEFNSDEVHVDTANDRVGINGDPGTTGSGVGVQFDIWGQNIRAGSTTSNLRTDDATKNYKLWAVPYDTTPATDWLVLAAYSTLTGHALEIGGGSSGGYAATRVSLYGAASVGTTTGTEIVRATTAGVVVEPSGYTAKSSYSALEVNSTTKLFYPPRMTDAQMSGVGSLSAITPGGLAYNTDTGKLFWMGSSSNYVVGVGTSRSPGLTSTRVPFVGANGTLEDDADMTFTTDTLTVTKIQPTTIELGNVGDTTLTRSAAGVISVEGNTIITSATIRSGTGTPEGAVTAPVGTLFLRTDGGAGTTLYVKESGTGNTGWAAK